MENLLKLYNIALIKQNHKILNDINLQVNIKEFVNIIGPNGGGKSSLLKIIIGSQKPSRGYITKNNKLKIGYVPQNLKLNPMIPLDVDAFLQTANFIQNTYLNIINSLGIKMLLSKSMHTLSGGEKQIILLARALLGRPNLLILDEPAQGLDIEGRSRLYKILVQLNQKENLTILMVSHNLDFVHAASTRVICLNSHICCQGSPVTIKTNPKYQSLYNKNSAMVFYEHSHDHVHDNFISDIK